MAFSLFLPGTLLNMPWFSLAGCQVPTKAALSLPLLNWTGEKKNMTKGLWVEIRPGRSVSNYCHRQSRLDLGKLIYHHSNQNSIMRSKTKS